ncbi:3-isopropylmalate dehydratase large subunit, chloroplastic-like [Asparagus officinalis]|uniref:3-isopropylmalate dehydratase large subunit, chloroplastic-like n=1 Tax=Asparagus officinalis TaxID=4686 RepID=UPI00098E4C4B|nr:3-isopropylmalate dehydratase large subunit, chloroplastic-like [Asparagus officinalis]XP_020247094.1 3-isopropylmalate dehydratase large subunit, chloroplastic-like [Asparagus officinalis]XP_020247095.1 3-isopropylmalate dehydratase large subunit, chloroplastic-like [Asparagus officinalis]
MFVGRGRLGSSRGSLGRTAKAYPDYKCVYHIALAQEGHCKPGEVLLGTDSHTRNAGAFDQFATSIGNTDVGFVMGTGKLLFKLDGDMPDYLLAKDLILQIFFMIPNLMSPSWNHWLQSHILLIIML